MIGCCCCSLRTCSVPDPVLSAWLTWTHWMLSPAPWHWCCLYSTLRVRKLKDTLLNYLTQRHSTCKCCHQKRNPNNLMREPGPLHMLSDNSAGLSAKPVTRSCWLLEFLAVTPRNGKSWGTPELPEGQQCGKYGGFWTVLWGAAGTTEPYRHGHGRGGVLLVASLHTPSASNLLWLQFISFMHWASISISVLGSLT